jgi:hypothetical protein
LVGMPQGRPHILSLQGEDRGRKSKEKQASSPTPTPTRWTRRLPHHNFSRRKNDKMIAIKMSKKAINNKGAKHIGVPKKSYQP